MCVSTCGGTGAAGSSKAGRMEASPAWCWAGGKMAEAQARPQGTTHLSDVVEIPVRHLLLGGQLLHLVEQHVHLELGAQVLQPAVAERLSGRTRTRQGAQSLWGGTREGTGLRLPRGRRTADKSKTQVALKWGETISRSLGQESPGWEGTGRDSHGAVDNQGHQHIDVSHKLLQVGIRQLHLWATGTWGELG